MPSLFIRPDSSSKQAGFSLVEMITVAAIIGIMSTVIVINFSRNRFDPSQSTAIVKAAVRLAQTKAVASLDYNGYRPCGYGITYIDSTRIAIYVGPNAAAYDCPNINKNYQSGRDTIISYQKFTDPHLEFKSSFSDIFFLPPDPKTYLNNVYNLSQGPIEIKIGVVGTACPTNCKSIYVYPSGNIETN